MTFEECRRSSAADATRTSRRRHCQAVARTSSPSAWEGGLREVSTLGLLFGLYKLARLAGSRQQPRAAQDARDILSVEQWLHLPSESHLQSFLLAHMTLARAANMYYAGVHFPLTIGALAWCWRYRRRAYQQLRRALILLTSIGLLLHLALPVAPPRLLPDLGFADIAADIGPSVYGPPAQDTLSDQYAAMPSLHVGWAAVLTLVLLIHIRSRWRWLWVAHPVLTVLVVVATANHFWADAAVALLLVWLIFSLIAKPRPPGHQPDDRYHPIAAHQEKP